MLRSKIEDVLSKKPIRIRNYIDGHMVNDDIERLHSINPATGQVYAQVPDSPCEVVDQAARAANGAFHKWSSLSRTERAAWLNKIADEIESNLDLFALAESRDQGKPVWLAKAVDIPRAVYNFRFFAGSILHQTERSNFHDNAQAISYVTRFPVGVAGLITPWNLPLYLLTWKIAPALAMGNTAVIKASELTSVTAYLLSMVIDHIQLPNGVCNFVYGGGKAGSAISSHPDIPLVSFTGGTLTGKRIAEAAAPLCKKLSLELGGKNPAIVFASTDLDKLIPHLIKSSFTNQGEICLCSSRILVEDAVFDRFLELFVVAARELKVGDPSDDSNQLGAVNSRQHMEKIHRYVERAQKSGATIHCGYLVDEMFELAEQVKNGCFVRPTVISGLDNDHACIQEEIFGPVVTVQPFSSEMEAVTLANSVQYGLSATVWTADGSQAQRVARKVEAGTVWINCWLVRDLHMPFGGMKASGTGRESAEESLEFFTEAKTICTSLGDL